MSSSAEIGEKIRREPQPKYEIPIICRVLYYAMMLSVTDAVIVAFFHLYSTKPPSKLYLAVKLTRC